MEKINSILTRKKYSKWLDSLCSRVFGHATLYGTGFEDVHSHVSELWAICTHYLGNYSSGLLSCTFFLWEGQGHFWIRIKFHLEREKGRGKRGYGGEVQNEGYFCKIPIIKQDTKFISHTFGQTNF